MSPATAHDPSYAAEIKLIHTARNKLALTEDSYRAIIWRFSGNRTDSSAKLTPAQRRAVIAHFATLGFKPIAGGGGRADRRVQRAAEPYNPQVGKLQALWHALFELGVVRADTREACEAFVCRQTGIEKLRWNNSDDLRLAIDSLKGWCQREGYDPKPEKTSRVVKSPQDGRYAPGLIRAQWARLQKLGAFRRGIFAGLDTWMHNQGWHVSDPAFLEDDAADEAIRRLGIWLRRISRPESGDGGD